MNVGTAYIDAIMNVNPLREGFGRMRQETQQFADETERQVSKAMSHWQKFGSFLKSTFSNVLQGIAQGIGQGIWNSLSQGMSLVTKGAIGLNATLETSAVSWKVLLGSAAAADAKLKEIYKFAATTPFEFPEVEAASRIMQTFGGSALNTSKNLTMIGDVAAGTNQSFQDVALWMSRMYDAMQSGRPFGEAAARLQEMGAISGVARAKLEALQESGASGAKLWAALTQEVSRFGGMMTEQSNTWTGRLSTLKDQFNQLSAIAGKPIFDALSKVLARLVTALDPEGNAGTFAQRLATKISDAFTKIADFAQVAWMAAQKFGDYFQLGLQKVQDVWSKYLQPIVDSALAWGENIIVQLANGIVAGVGAVVSALGYIGDVITSWLEPHSPPKLLPNLDKWGMEAASIYFDGWKKGDFSAFDDLSSTIEGYIRSIASVGGIEQKDVVPTILGSRDTIRDIVNAIQSGHTATAELMAQVMSTAGPAGALMQALVQDYIDLSKAQGVAKKAQDEYDHAQDDVAKKTREIDQAQRELNKTTREYELRLRPLRAELDKVAQAQNDLRNAANVMDLKNRREDANDPTLKRLAEIGREEQRIRDAQRVAELNKTIAETDDPAKKRAAELEIERIGLEEKRRAVEENRAAAKDELQQKEDELAIQEASIKTQLEAIEKEKDAATQILNARIQSLNDEKQAAEDILQARKEVLEDATKEVAKVQERLDAQKSIVNEILKTNALTAEQNKLLEEQAKAAEAAAKALGAGSAASGLSGAGGLSGLTPPTTPKGPSGIGTLDTETSLDRAGALPPGVRKIMRALDDLKKKVEDFFDPITSKLDGFQEKWDKFWDNAGKGVDALKTKFAEFKADPVGSLISWGASILIFVTDTLTPEVERVLRKLGKAMGDWVVNTAAPYIEEKWPDFQSAVGKLMDRLQKDIEGRSEDFGKSIGKMLSKAMELSVGLIFFSTDDLAAKLSSWIDSPGWTVTAKELQRWMDRFAFWFNPIPTLVKDLLKGVGEALGSGLWDGISKLWPTVSKDIEDLFKSVITKVKDIFGIKSPSTIFSGIGSDIVQGLFDGVKSMLGTLGQSITDLLLKPFNDAKDGIGKATGAILGIIKPPLQTSLNTMGGFGSGIAGVVRWVLNALHVKDFNITDPPVPALAKGTSDFKGGLAMVGEQGPELVVLPQHAIVVPNGITQSIMANGGIPGFAGGLNLPSLFDMFKNGPQWLADQAMKAVGLVAPQFPGEMASAGGAVFDLVKGWLTKAVVSFMQSALPITQKQMSDMISFAEKHVGEPYTWGGGHGGAAGFDCSGFVAAILDAGGISNPHGIVTAFYEWMNKGRTGVVDIGIDNPYAPADVQHMGIGLMGQWYESGGRAGGVGRTSDYFSNVGHPPSFNWDAKSAGQDLSKIDIVQSLENMRRGGKGQWSALYNGGIIREPILGIGLNSGGGYSFGEGIDEAIVPLDASRVVGRKTTGSDFAGREPITVTINLNEEFQILGTTIARSIVSDPIALNELATAEMTVHAANIAKAVREL